MIPDTLDRIIAKLVEKTADGKALWIRGERETEYILTFKTGVVSIDHYKNAFDKVIDFSVSNLDGHQVDFFEISKKENERDYNDLKKLYDIVYAKDFKIDETIEGILHELDSDDIVGATEADPKSKEQQKPGV